MRIYSKIEEARKDPYARYALLKTGDVVRNKQHRGVIIGIADDVPLKYSFGDGVTPTAIAYIEKNYSERERLQQRGLYGIHRLEWRDVFSGCYLPRENNILLSNALLIKALGFLKSGKETVDHRKELIEFFNTKREPITKFLERKVKEWEIIEE